MDRPRIVWNDSFSVGIPQLDQHHQELARLINDLTDCLPLQGRVQELLNILTALDFFAGYHFEYEEKLLAGHGFPGLANHRNEHRRFGAVISEMRRGATQGKVRPDGLFTYLTHWWLHHVLKEDMEYKPFVSKLAVA